MTGDDALASPRGLMLARLEGELPLPTGAVLSASGLELPEGVPFEAWLLLVRALESRVVEAAWAGRTALLALADAAVYGEDRYGEDAAQALPDYAYGTVAQALHVARRVPLALRREFEGSATVGPAHFYAVAKVTDGRGVADPERQREYLAVAEEEGLSGRELARQVDRDDAVRHGRDPDEEEAARALARAARTLAEVLPPRRWATAVGAHLLAHLMAVREGNRVAFRSAANHLADVWGETNNDED